MGLQFIFHWWLVYESGFSREAEPIRRHVCVYVYIYKARFIIRNWLTWLWLWRLTRSKICQTDGEPKKDSGIVLVWKPGSRLKKSQYFSSSPKAKGKIMSQFKGSQTGGVLPYSLEGQHLHATQTFSWLDEASPHWEQQSALLSLPIQILISSRNILTDIPRIMFDRVWKPHGPVKLTHKINHHDNYGCKCFPLFQRYIHLFSDEL